MEKPTLVILAAGMGSRYGGLKQMDTFTKEGDTIIDFSLFDAIEAGFGKFVFVIRKSFEKEFKKQFADKVKNKAKVEFVYQEVENVPEKYQNKERVKPWGTGHALLMAKEVVNENFAIINGDDFYGKEAFKAMAEVLSRTDKTSTNYCMMAYQLKNALSKYGYVSRGECEVNADGFLQNVTERTHIERLNGELKQKDEKGNLIPIDENTIVSMNFWGFTPKIFEVAETLFEDFLKENYAELKAEFYLPTIVKHAIDNNLGTVKVLQSDAKWYGVTYKDDKIEVTEAIENMKEKNVYPQKLWGND